MLKQTLIECSSKTHTLFHARNFIATKKLSITEALLLGQLTIKHNIWQCSSFLFCFHFAHFSTLPQEILHSIAYPACSSA